MDYVKKILIDFEIHSVEGIEACFQNGVSSNAVVNGTPLVYHLINMYARGPLFKKCMRAFVDHGLEFEDRVLLAVLLDDPALLEEELKHDEEALFRKYSLDCTFTPLYQVSLLHVCAEYNHVEAAKVLINRGADVNARAGIDIHGFGGHTPVFHTVNQDANKGMDMLKFLVSCHADLLLTVKGLIWGKGYDWETFIPAVNPVSYAMMGLLRQFQRTEEQIYEVVSFLMKAAWGIEYRPLNVPNKYLKN